MAVNPVGGIFQNPQINALYSTDNKSDESIFASAVSSENVQNVSEGNYNPPETSYLPDIAKDAAGRINFGLLGAYAQNVSDLISTVNSKFEFAPQINENSPTTTVWTDGRRGERTYEETDVMIDGVLTHVAHGIEKFKDYTNENVETYVKDENGEWQQTGGYGVLEYHDDKAIEIHYDDFGKKSNEKENHPVNGYSVVVGDDGGMEYNECNYYLTAKDELAEETTIHQEFPPEEEDYEEFSLLEEIKSFAQDIFHNILSLCTK